MKKFRYSMAFLSVILGVVVLFMPTIIEGPVKDFAEEHDLTYVLEMNNTFVAVDPGLDGDPGFAFNIDFYDEDGLHYFLTLALESELSNDTINIMYTWMMILLIPFLLGLYGLVKFKLIKNKTYPNIILLVASFVGILGQGFEYTILTSILFFAAAAAFILIKIKIYSLAEMLENYQRRQEENGSVV